MSKKKSLPKKPRSLAGLTDIIPDNGSPWNFLTMRLARVASGFGFARVEMPILEDRELYEDMKIEQGSLVYFPDPENKDIALRPEMLPSLIRAHAERKNVPEDHKLSKWYYLAPSIVYNQQQRGFTASWEYGFEIFGEFTSLNEAHLISLVWKFLTSLGMENLSLEINSIGKPECRKNYEETLRNFLQNKKYELCNDCVAQMEDYPMAVFSCKNLECQAVAAEAPQVVDFLDQDCLKNFTNVLESLDETSIAYSLNPMLVGKPGQSGVVFSIKAKDDQNEYFLGSGAHQDEIYEEMTGKKVSCFGFVGYMEVLNAALHGKHTDPKEDIKPEVFLVPLGDLAAKKALRLFSELWDEHITVHDHFSNSGVKNQLKLAETYKASIALIIGQKEAMDEMVILRDVRSGMQEIFQYEHIIDEVKKRLGRI